MATLRRSLLITFLSSSGAAFLQFLVSVLLARMLSPSEIGIFSITVVFVNIAHIFRDFGVASYVQREAELTTEKLRSAIGVMFTSAWTISLFLLLISQSVGEWFGEPGIVPVMRVLAIGFLIIPFGSLTNSLLVREFAAEKQAIITIVGTVTFCVSCLVFAALGFGTMSLAWANLCNVVACALASIPFRPKGVPYLPPFVGWGKVSHFGAGTLPPIAPTRSTTRCQTAVRKAGKRPPGWFVQPGKFDWYPFFRISPVRPARMAPFLICPKRTSVANRWRPCCSVPQRSTDRGRMAGVRLDGAVRQGHRADAVWPQLDRCVQRLPLALAAAVAMVFHYTPTA